MESSSMRIIFRRPRESDLPRLSEIYNHAKRETAATFDTEEKGPRYFEHFIPGDNLHRMLVAEVEGQVVAYGGTYAFSQRKAHSQFAEVMTYVHPDWQKSGVGTAMLDKIHSDTDGDGGFLRGLHTIIGLCNKENLHTQRVLDRLGYVCKGEMTEVAEKLGRRHSLLVYQRHVKAAKPNL